MNAKEKIFFISDMHLGSSVFNDPRTVEKQLVRWLNAIGRDAKALYLLGDVFDFWFEYKRSVPRGFTRFLGKLAELSDAGVEIHYFIGNHDIWIDDYLPEEIGLILHKEPLLTTIAGKTFYLAHGDGLGDYSRSFKLIRWIFHNKVCQFLYRSIHPDLGIKFGYAWAKRSRQKELKHPLPYFGGDKEHLVLYADSCLQTHPEIDYFIFGHRHILLDLMLNHKTRMLIIGDWLRYFSFAVFDGEKLKLDQYNAV